MAAKRGHDVTLYEKGSYLGGLVPVAAIVKDILKVKELFVEKQEEIKETKNKISSFQVDIQNENIEGNRISIIDFFSKESVFIGNQLIYFFDQVSEIYRQTILAKAELKNITHIILSGENLKKQLIRNTVLEMGSDSGFNSTSAFSGIPTRASCFRAISLASSLERLRTTFWASVIFSKAVR